jgi:Chaperone for flagella basal body P-ring formation
MSFAARFVPLLLFAVSVSGKTETIVLRADSAVPGAYFNLGEIAAVDADDASRAGELAGLRIGKSPRPGRTLALARAEVERALLRLRPELAGRLTVAGPERLSVQRGSLETLELARVQEEAESALRKALELRYERFEIEPAGRSSDGRPTERLLVPRGRIELRPRVPEMPVLAGRVSVWTDVLVDGQHYQSVPLQFAVHGFPEPAQAPRYTASAVAVKQGDPVVVRFVQGAIAVETLAVATRPARAGEVIRVRNAETNQTYQVRVTAPGTVETLWR